MAKIILDYKKDEDESKIIHQGDIIVIESPDKEISTYIVFVKCEKNKTPQKMLVGLHGGTGIMHYDNLGNMTYKTFRSRFSKCKITFIPKDEAIIKIDRING